MQYANNGITGKIDGLINCIVTFLYITNIGITLNDKDQS